MAISKGIKDRFYKGGFPNHLAPDSEKKTDAFGLKMAKAIEYEWFFRPESGACAYYDKRDKYHKLRLYARGEQDTKLYKDLIAGGDESTYHNYDWRPLQVVPKFVNLIVNQMGERLYSVKAEATDKYSTDLKNKHKKNLERYILARPVINEARHVLGVDIGPQDAGEYPETQEELDLYMQMKYKPAIEIASEEAIKFTLDLNDYEDVQSQVIEDIATIGIGAVKHCTDPTKGIIVEGVDPADMVHAFPKKKDFRNVHYYGEVKRISIMELKRISNGKFSDEELRAMAKTTSEWGSYHGFNANDRHYREDDINGTMVDVLFFNFKSTNTISYKKKYNKNGGYKMIEKDSEFKKTDPNYKGYDVVKKMIDVWYEGALVLGTEKLFNYKLCENMVRPKGKLNIAKPNYIVYAPEIYQNRTKSLVERIIPYVDQMQQTHIKIQQIIAKARPNGIYIDVAGLSEIDMGDGNFLTPMEVIKIYDETGNIIGTSLTHEGDYNYGREPIKELKNGVIDGLDRLISTYNHYLNLLRDAIGIPQGADASTPHPDMAVGVQEQLALNSNTATRHILRGALNITERVGESMALRIKDIFMYSDLKEVYINAIGRINVKVLEALKNYHLHDIGINIELKPDMEQKQQLEVNINNALAKELITFDDAQDIRTAGNLKLANQLLKVRRIRREKEKRQHEKDMEMVRAEGQAMVAERSSQAKIFEYQEKARAGIMQDRAKSKNKMKEISHEAKEKKGLMFDEFRYSMILNDKQAEADAIGKKYMEDRKDKRQDRNNTQASQLIEQREYNTPPKTFESSEDNISGKIEMSEQDPQ